MIRALGIEMIRGQEHEHLSILHVVESWESAVLHWTEWRKQEGLEDTADSTISQEETLPRAAEDSPYANLVEVDLAYYDTLRKGEACKPTSVAGVTE